MSPDEAVAIVEASVPVNDRWVYLSTGDNFDQFIRFYANTKLAGNAGREQDLFRASHRKDPIPLFGRGRHKSIPGTGVIVADEGSTVHEILDFLEDATTVLYRDPAGNYIYGQVQGQIGDWVKQRSTFSYTVTRTST